MIEERQKKEAEEIKKGRIIKKEEIVKGVRIFRTFGTWIKSFSALIFTMYILLLAGFNFGNIFFSWYLGEYSDGKFADTDYESILIWAIALTVAISALGTSVFSIGSYLVSRNVYSNLLTNLLRRPMSFFDSTSIGSILARLISDKDSVDTEIGMFIQTFAFGFIQLIGIILVIGSTSPSMLLIFVFVIVGFVATFKK